MKSKRDQPKSKAVEAVETYGGAYHLLESTFQPQAKPSRLREREEKEDREDRPRRMRK